MNTKELIEELKRYRDFYNKTQISYFSYQLSHEAFNEIIKRLEELEELKEACLQIFWNCFDLRAFPISKPVCIGECKLRFLELEILTMSASFNHFTLSFYFVCLY